MALILKRVTHPYECVRCCVTKKLISYGEEYYWIEPVIVFDDGTRYFFYEYFDDRIFEDLVEDFEDFIYDYEDMVDEIY